MDSDNCAAGARKRAAQRAGLLQFLNVQNFLYVIIFYEGSVLFGTRPE